jgi:hypothetical protein
MDRGTLDGRCIVRGARRFQFTVEHMVGRREIELAITYTVTPFIEATYWQPAEGGECEIVSVKHEGREFPLSSEEEDALLEQAIARSRDDWADDQAAEADWRYQEYRDRLLMEKWERQS